MIEYKDHLHRTEKLSISASISSFRPYQGNLSKCKNFKTLWQEFQCVCITVYTYYIKTQKKQEEEDKEKKIRSRGGGDDKKDKDDDDEDEEEDEVVKAEKRKYQKKPGPQCQ